MGLGFNTDCKARGPDGWFSMQLIEPTRISAQLLDYAPPDGVTFNEFRLQTLRVAPAVHSAARRVRAHRTGRLRTGGRRQTAPPGTVHRARSTWAPERASRSTPSQARPFCFATKYDFRRLPAASARVPAFVSAGSMRNCRQPAATFLRAAVRCQGDLVIGGAERVHVPRGSVFLVPAGVPLPIANESAAAAGACLARASIGLYPSSAVFVALQVLASLP